MIEKTRVSGKTVYLVQRVPDSEATCENCCFYKTHISSFPGPGDCFVTRRAETCMSRGDERDYVWPQGLRRILEIATARLVGEGGSS